MDPSEELQEYSRAMKAEKILCKKSGHGNHGLLDKKEQ